MKHEELSIIQVKVYCYNFQKIFLNELIFLSHRTSAVSPPVMDFLA